MDASDPFNLNINSYSSLELENLLELTQPYDKTHINTQINTMKQNISQDTSLDKHKNTEVLGFLDKVAHKLNEYLSFQLTNRENGHVVSGFNELSNKVKSYDNHTLIVDPMSKIGLNSAAGTGIGPPAPPGKINPIDFRSIQKVVNIDTRFRDNYATSRCEVFNVTLPMKLSNILSVTLNTVELPSSIYNIDISRNDAFDVSGVSYSLPEGTYDISGLDINKGSILAEMSNLLSGSGVTYSIDKITGKSTFAAITASGEFNMSFNISRGDASCNNWALVNNSLQTKLGWMLGFRKGSYTGHNTYTSEAPVFMKYPRYLYVCVDDYVNSNNDYFTSAFNQSILNKNILARIDYAYLTQSEGYRQSLVARPNTTRTYFGPIDIQRMKISLIDEFGNSVNLQKLDWSFTLSYEQIYEY